MNEGVAGGSRKRTPGSGSMSLEQGAHNPGAGSTKQLKGVGAGSTGGGSRELDGREPGASTSSVTPS
jgi:hypothetical protein